MKNSPTIAWRPVLAWAVCLALFWAYWLLIIAVMASLLAWRLVSPLVPRRQSS